MRDSIVRATCPTCGDLVLTTADLGLQLDQGHSRFLFLCPRCHQHVSHDVPAGIVHILLAAGVHPMDSLPELVSADDLADFLADFDRVDCLDELRRLGA